MVNNLKYIYNLDALRAFAAIGVIFAHFFSIIRVPDFVWFAKVSALGNTGVSLFFVLSGFVITRILLQPQVKNDYFKSFYMRRVLRIFPLYYFALIVYYVIQYGVGITSDIPPFDEQIFYYTYLQNFATTFNWAAEGPGHFWSLAVEEHFYLFWPALVYVAMKGRLQILLLMCLGLIVGVHVLRYIMLTKGYEINVFTFTRLDQLVMGGVIAIAEVRGFIQKKNFPYFVGILLLGLIGVVILESIPFVLAKELFKHTAFGIFYAGIIVCCSVIDDSNPISKFLQIQPLQFLGKISYGIYVWHVLSIRLVDHYFSLPVSITFVLVLFLTFILSWLSYKLLEQPFLKLKTRFKYTTISNQV